MTNRYQEETLQIHAPAELIQRTKQAMREEEKRILQEEGGRVSLVKQERKNAPDHSADSREKFRRGRSLRWAGWIAGAAAFFLLVCASASMLRSGTSGSPMRVPQSTDAGGAPSAEGKAESAKSAAEGASTADTGMAGAPAAGIETADASAPDEEVAGASMADKEMEDMSLAAADIEEASTADAEMADAAMPDKEMENASVADAKMENASMFVTETEEPPSFYGEPDTVRVVVQNTAFYVTSDWYGSWAAYAAVGGKQYVIVGGAGEETADAEEFAAKAYGLLEQERSAP